jgi:hypothetical protein
MDNADHKKHLEELHKAATKKFDEYVKEKGTLSPDHHKKIHEAKKNWQASWSELMDVMIVLENLEL